MSTVCPSCGDEYEAIGLHWSTGQCSYPDVTERAQSIVTGLVLGGATVRTDNTAVAIQCYSANERLCEWLDDELGWITTGVTTYRTAAESAELSTTPDPDVDTYSSIYTVRTRSLPQFDRYEWGGSVPSYLLLTPTTARVWYAQSGSLVHDERFPSSKPYATIASGRWDTRRLADLVRDAGCPADPVVDDARLRFGVDGTASFCDWLGEPVPGVESKWVRSDDE